MNEQTPGPLPGPWTLTRLAAPTTEAPPAREPRQRRKPREAKADKPRKERKPRAAAPAVEPAPRKPRKARKDKVERAAPETIKVTMKEYAVMRVGDDAKTFIKLHGILSDLGKGSRSKLLAELQKVFS